MKFFLIIATLLFAFSAVAVDCNKVIASFDVGSGSTKMKVANVDVCERKITQYLLDTAIKVSYKDDLETNKGTLSKTIIQTGKEALLSLKTQATNLKATIFKGVATSAFRDAKNGLDAIKELSNTTDISLKIVSQKEEAILGYHGAVSMVDQHPFPVWDIGGGSMQLTSKSGLNYSIFEGQMGAVPFRNLFLKQIKKSNAKTPNPITKEEAKQGLELAKTLCQQENLDPLLKEAIKKARTVLGIGGVHYFSLKQNFDPSKDVITKKDLEKALQKLIGKTDQDIGGRYASSDVTNVILVLGYMEELKIRKIIPLKVNLTDALMVEN